MTEPERTGSDATMADTVAADKVAAAIAAAEHDEDAGRREDAASHFTERFASVLVEAGIPRMPARVFAALLAADSPAGARLADSVRYFEFVSAELPQVLARWRERNARE